MQTKKRYAYLLIVFLFAVLLRLSLIGLSRHGRKRAFATLTGAYGGQSSGRWLAASFERQWGELWNVAAWNLTTTPVVPSSKGRPAVDACSMDTCFDHSRCRLRPMRVYIHPRPDNASLEVDRNSESYEKILTAIRESKFYTENPDEACLFVLPWDTLSRDRLSPSYVPNMRSKLRSLPKHLWRNGMNHLIFNLYSGTWPDYELTDLGFDPGKAILAKASFSTRHYRKKFDISLALFHEVLPLRGPLVTADSDPSMVTEWSRGSSRYLLVFKGKRYVFGIGSETRNVLYHLHNGRDVIMLTTCKHGKDWKKNQDERCPIDNAMYDRWDYEELMKNSSFCLVPRGRRLGSFRFLESLEKGCIPVIVSNDWVLPFSEVINWTQVTIQADERALLQIPLLLRLIPASVVRQMKIQAKHLYRLYFGSVDKIVDTVLQIIEDRIWSAERRTKFVWNYGLAGARYHFPNYSSRLADYPFYKQPVEDCRLTAIITCSTPFSERLSFLIDAITKSKFIEKIVLLCETGWQLPTGLKWNILHNVVDLKEMSLIQLVKNQSTYLVAVFSDRVSVEPAEIDYAVELLRWLPHRLVGFDAWNLVAGNSSHPWLLTESRQDDPYAVLTGGALFFHKYYADVVLNPSLKSLRRILREWSHCWDILLNYIVSEAIGSPPVRVLLKGGVRSSNDDHFALLRSKQLCLDRIIAETGAYSPFRQTSTAFNVQACK